ncbi:MAG: UDP-N-acetylmuramoyl-L-alanyl-D-glutamate--2,6-diaminopimelate ligase [Actinomycetota bacterium]
MRLDRVVSTLEAGGAAARLHGAGDIVVTDLAYDSRTAGPGSLFFALRGRYDDGHRHAPAAVASGALAVCCDHRLEVPAAQLIVSDTRAAMNALAAPFFGDAGRGMAVIGITGTNGKTTTAWLVHAILADSGRRAGLVGTIEVRLGDGRSIEGLRTTPESVDLQRLLAAMAAGGAEWAAVEATSIGIAQGRLAGTRLAVAVFTNLSQDHLDYHGTLEAYFDAKRALFTPEQVDRALVSADNVHGRRLLDELQARGEIETWSYGAENADFRAVDVRSSPGGARFRAVGPTLDAAVEFRLPGAFNVSNALAAAAAVSLLGVDSGAITNGLHSVAGVPGRFEPIEAGGDLAVIVDYAHTPDGLENVLRAARQIASGDVISVFGCGGDRDRGKRPEMGTVAGRLADLVVVTSDNPRSEDPLAIIRDIEEGLRSEAPRRGYAVVPDRAAAIEQAIDEARPGDIVVIAGKGHERFQEAAGVRRPFDDREVARRIVERRRRGGASGSPASPHGAHRGTGLRRT